MPLQTTKGYNLKPDLLGSVQKGQGIVSNRQALGVNQLAIDDRAKLRDLRYQALGVGQRVEADKAESKSSSVSGEVNAIVNSPIAKSENDVLSGMGFETPQQKGDIKEFSKKIELATDDQLPALIKERAGEVVARGGDPSHTLKLLDMQPEQIRKGVDSIGNIVDRDAVRQMFAIDPKAAESFLDSLDPMRKAKITGMNQGLTSRQRDRASLLATLDDPNSSIEAKKSARIDLGLDPKASGGTAKNVVIGGVDYTFDPTTKSYTPVKIDGKDVTAKTIAESEALIAEAKKRGEGAGKLASSTIESGFKKIGSINGNLINLDRAIAALDRGAGTGAVEKLFPSFKAATVELNQIQKELGLDVVGAVTFGALSQGELDLAKDVALPTGLNEPELREWLNRKKEAQTKLRDYFNEQMQFLDQGGSVPEWIQQKSDERKATKQQDVQNLSDDELFN